MQTVDDSAGGGGMMGNFAWKKSPRSRARFHRSEIDTSLALAGVAYPEVPRGSVPQIGLGPLSPNARLRLSGGGLPSYRDLLVHIVPGNPVPQIMGSDPAQAGADIPLNKLLVKVDGAKATFNGRFAHPTTGRLVPFQGVFRRPLNDGTPDALQPAQGRGVFRGPAAAGAVSVLPVVP